MMRDLRIQFLITWSSKSTGVEAFTQISMGQVIMIV